MLASTAAYAFDWSPATHTVQAVSFVGGTLNEAAPTALLVQAKSAGGTHGLVRSGLHGAVGAWSEWQDGQANVNWNAAAYTAHVGDFNGDRRSDVLLQATQAGSLNHVLLGDASGKFTAVAQVIPMNFQGIDWDSVSHEVIVGDYNGDGRSDVFLQAKAKSGRHAVFLAQTSGDVFGAPVQSWNGEYLGVDWSAETYRFVAGDFTGDGRADLMALGRPQFLLIAGDIDIPLFISPPIPNGVFPASTGGSFIEAPPAALQWPAAHLGGEWDPAKSNAIVADFSGDRIADVFLQAREAGGASHLLRVSGTGLELQQTLADGYLGLKWSLAEQLLVAGDYNDDGRADLYFAKNGIGDAKVLAGLDGKLSLRLDGVPLSASPDQCLFGQGGTTCSTTATWSTSGIEDACVFLKIPVSTNLGCGAAGIKQFLYDSQGWAMSPVMFLIKGNNVYGQVLATKQLKTGSGSLVAETANPCVIAPGGTHCSIRISANIAGYVPEWCLFTGDKLFDCNKYAYDWVAGSIGETLTLRAGRLNTSPELARLVVWGESGNAPPRVMISRFEANPATIGSGSSTTLFWESSGATSCTLNGSTVATSGSQATGALVANADYALNCTGAGGSDAKSLTVTVLGLPAIGSFKAEPASVAPNGSSTLSWNATNASSCALDGATVATSGSQSTGPLAAARDYTLACSNGLDTASSKLTVTVQPGAAITRFDASPASIDTGASSTLAWESTGATACTLNGSPVATSGSQASGALTASTVFTLNCTASGGSDSKSLTVTVLGIPDLSSFKAEPASVAPNGSSTLSWNVANASSCTLDGATVATSGSQSTGSLTASREYTLACSNGVDSRNAKVTVAIVQPGSSGWSQYIKLGVCDPVTGKQKFMRVCRVPGSCEGANFKEEACTPDAACPVP